MEKRKPTYGSAVRMAELILILSKSWRPVTVDQICDELRISVRTAQRYRKAPNENLSSSDGGDLLRVIREGGIEKWYLADQDEISRATYFRIMSVYVAMALLKSMEGTVLKDGMDSVWEMLVGNLKPSDRVKFQQLDQKIRYSGFGRKNYSEQNEVLKELLNGLINNRKVQILHYSHRVKRERYHIVHPYTILLHRDSLYLSAYDEEYEDIRTFLIDRIKDTVLKNEKFRCRVNFNVDNLTDGSFGVYKSNGDKAVKVRVRFKEILWEYLTTRKWHRSQIYSNVKRTYEACSKLNIFHRLNKNICQVNYHLTDYIYAMLFGLDDCMPLDGISTLFHQATENA